MQRIAISRCGTVSGSSGTNGVVKGWSVLSRRCSQRTFSSGSDSAAGGAGGGSAGGGGVGGRPGGRRDEDGNAIPAGRGRGAFSQFLRMHERKIDKHMEAIDGPAPDKTDGTGGKKKTTQGQFDDAEKKASEKIFNRNTRDRGPAQGDRSAAPPGNDWQAKWFAHEDTRLAEGEDEEDEQADMAELDDDEDDDHFDQNEEYDPEVWKGYTPEKFDEFKKLGLRFQNEEEEQMAAIKANWQQMKKDCIEQHGTADHLPLPDIIITHEMSYDAPAGKATADRAMPLPRSMERIAESMELPAGLGVVPGDEEYEQVVNMWKSLSRNNSTDERIQKQVIGQISSFIAKHRHSDTFQKALKTQDFPERRGRRPR